MKVLIITHCSGGGGSNRCVLNMVDNVGNRGIEYIVLLPMRGPLTQELEKRGIKYYVVPFPMWVIPDDYSWGHKALSVLRYEAQKLIALNAIVKVCKKNRIDLIHTNSSVTEMGQVVAKRMNISHIWHIREYLDYANWQYIYNNKKVKTTYEMANVVVTVSDTLKEYYKKYFGLKNAITVYDGITEYHGSVKYEEFTIMFSGGCMETKGVWEVLNAYKILIDKGVRLKLILAAAKGNLEIENFIKKYKLDNIITTGYMNNIRDVRAKCHLSLMCSKNEAFGLVTIESMAEGTLVIASDSGANMELIKDGKNGLIYKQGNYEELASKIYKVYKEYEYYQPIIDQAKIDSKEMYSVNTSVNKVYGMYRQLVS